jgi:hypothetical protein
MNIWHMMTWLPKNTSSVTFSVEQTGQNICFVGDTGDLKYKAWCLNCNQSAVPYFIVCIGLIQNVWVTVYSVHCFLVIEDMTLHFKIAWNNVHPSPHMTQTNTHIQINDTHFGDHREWHGITISYIESFVTPEAFSYAFLLKGMLMSRHHLVKNNHWHFILHCILQWLLFLLEMPTIVKVE